MGRAVWAATRNSTVVNWGLGHYCNVHQTEVTLEHTGDCAGVQNLALIKGYCNKLR